MINVIGLGYIGLPTALILAKSGKQVVGTDVKSDIVDSLREKKVTFEEPGMAELLEKALENEIEFKTHPVESSFYIITVPTPYDSVSKKLDCKYVEDATKSVLEFAEDGSIIVLESTVTPGAIDKYIRPIVEDYIAKTGKKINLAHAPERVMPGNIIYEIENNARTVGADSEEIALRVKEVYKSFCKSEINLTDIKTAEMTKVVENTFRDVNIAFANELAKICRQGGVDVNEVIRISNMHPRVNILSPGPGVGGHCISVDPWFLVGEYPLLTELIYKARKINDSMPEYVLKRAYDIMKKNGLKDFTRVGIYGLTYKENVDDVRNSPTMQMLEYQKENLASPLKVYDPMVKNDIVGNQYHNLDEFLADVDFVIIMVAHDEIIQNLDLLKGKLVLDTRNIDKNNKWGFESL
jgi:nucleotide sugar dehydrogenase